MADKVFRRLVPFILMVLCNYFNPSAVSSFKNSRVPMYCTLSTVPTSSSWAPSNFVFFIKLSPVFNLSSSHKSPYYLLTGSISAAFIQTVPSSSVFLCIVSVSTVSTSTSHLSPTQLSPSQKSLYYILTGSISTVLPSPVQLSLFTVSISPVSTSTSHLCPTQLSPSQKNPICCTSTSRTVCQVCCGILYGGQIPAACGWHISISWRRLT